MMMVTRRRSRTEMEASETTFSCSTENTKQTTQHTKATQKKRRRKKEKGDPQSLFGAVEPYDSEYTGGNSNSLF